MNSCSWGSCLCDPDKKPVNTCGACRTQTIECDQNAGVWKVGACTNVGMCLPTDAPKACTGGQQSCDPNTCQWGACTPLMCKGNPPVMPCGRCGKRKVTCNPMTGNYDVGTECEGEGPCSGTTTEACPGGQKTCNANTCQWGECKPLTCEGAAPVVPCGKCGKRKVTCNPADGKWVTGSECEGEGVCSGTETMACSGGQKTCVAATCQWGECKALQCTGEMPMRSCGTKCGHLKVTCDPNTGDYVVGTECVGEGACNANAMQSCPGGQQTCNPNTCEWGTCSPLRCSGSEPSVACGTMCGKRKVTCDPMTGEYVVGTECIDQGECEGGDTKMCTGGRQTCNVSTCKWGTCTPIPCTGSRPMERCGMCGTKAVTCDGATGNYVVGTACEGERGDCMPGDTKACPPGNTGSQTCSQSCAWTGVCTPVVTEPDPNPPNPPIPVE